MRSVFKVLLGGLEDGGDELFGDVLVRVEDEDEGERDTEEVGMPSRSRSKSRCAPCATGIVGSTSDREGW